MTNKPMTRDESIQKLSKLIEGIRIAQLTTASYDGVLRSRPMATQEVEFDGDLWFFTGKDSGKIAEITMNPQVNVSYSAPDKQTYVSVSGTSMIVDDKARMKHLWSPAFKIWFPGGLDDPNLALLKVEVTEAEYWDSPSSKFVQIVGFVKALTTGNHDQLGENEKLTLK